MKPMVRFEFQIFKTTIVLKYLIGKICKPCVEQFKFSMNFQLRKYEWPVYFTYELNLNIMLIYIRLSCRQSS